MKLSKDQVKHVAKLANLPLSEEEIEKYAKQLSAILDYVENLNKVNTDNIDPTFNTTGLENVMAEDKVSNFLTQEESLSNASKKDKGFFATKGVFNE